MGKKEITKMVADAVDVGTFYGAGLGALVVGGIALVLGGGFLRFLFIMQSALIAIILIGMLV